MSFNPGFNLSLQSGFQLPKGFGAGAGAAASAASGFSPWGMLLGLGGNLLNFGLSQITASQAYDRQKELMNLSQDYNSEEAMKQRQMSSMSHLRGELQRLGLNPDLMYQNGATQGSMSNAASAGAPSVMPANVPTFEGVLQGLQASAQMMNAETNQKLANAEVNVKNATVEKLYGEVDQLKKTVEGLGWDNMKKMLESEFWYDNAKNASEKLMSEADLTAAQANAAAYTACRLLAQLYADFGAEVRGFAPAGNPLPFDDATFNKVFGTNYQANQAIDHRIKELSRDLLNGQVDMQNIDKYFKELDEELSKFTGLSPEMTKEVVRALTGLVSDLMNFIPFSKLGKVNKAVKSVTKAVK